MCSLVARIAAPILGTLLTGIAFGASTTLDNGVDPWNLGKGDWIWIVSSSETAVGVATVQDLVTYEKNKGMQWITVKCGDGGSIFSQFNSTLVNACHSSGLKIFGWAYARGSNVTGEINVALNALGLGADGLIIDAEIEYETDTNPFNHQNAIKYCQAIHAAYPNRFLAHAPSPNYTVHTLFPYREFGMYCDATMPQCYWGYRSISPSNMVSLLDSQYTVWQNSMSGSGTNAIKPLVPVAQSDVTTIPGSEESDFVHYLRVDPTALSPTGYHGVSFWDCQEHTAAQWPAIAATNMPLMITNAPGIPGQPANRCADVGGAASFGARAYGAPTLVYQWRFNGAPISGATGSGLAMTNLQATNAGNYTVVVSNNFGVVTSRVAKLTVVSPAPVLQLAFADNFETNSASLWSLFQGSANATSDFTTNWGFDYSTQTFSSYGLVGFSATTQSIPVAPATTDGSRHGLKLTVNKNDATTAASGVSLYPKNMNFGSNYVLRFDAWINYNGGPGGGSGSTEYVTCGLNHTSTRVNWLPTYATSSDGLWFAVDGEGGSGGVDYRAFEGNGGVPAQLSFGSSGLAVSGAVSFDYVDLFYGSLFSYPAYETPGVPGKHWVQVELSQLDNVITWRLNGTVVAQRTNTSIYSSGNAMIGYMDPYSSIASPAADNYVIIDNVRVYTVVNPPVITAQPTNTTINTGAHAAFAVSTTGSSPLTYHWRLGSTNIPTGTNNALSLTDVQPSQAGAYSVIVTNAAGSATSSNALLSLIQMQCTGLDFTKGALRLTIASAPGVCTVLASSNLVNWSAVATLTNITGTVQFNDPLAVTLRQRFYRIIAPE